jgi:putative inorganic carbon (HCO3(-)) transporter
MHPPESFSSRAARWLTFGSAVSIVFSIAVSQILLAFAVVALLLSGEKLELPRIKLPLALFMLGTVIAVIFSPDRVAGLVQIRKFYVFLELLVVFSCLRSAVWIRALFLTWAGFAGISGLWGFVQFARKVHEARLAGQDDYSFYVGERITGFMSHWNTFSGQEMFALIMIGSLLLFAPNVRKRIWVWILCGVIMSAAVLLAETRAIWIGTAVAAVYLVWYWRRWLVFMAPVLIVAAYFVSPPVIQERFTSILHPQRVDSNQFRIVTWRTGLNMIKMHPLLGLGPEGPRIHFDQYLPADVTSKPEGSYIHLHNIYLEYAAERGVPTMLVLMWMLAMILYDFWVGLRKLPPGRNSRRFLLHGGIAVVLATLAEGVAEYNLGDSEVLTMFLVIVACGYLALERDIEFD